MGLLNRLFAKFAGVVRQQQQPENTLVDFEKLERILQYPIKNRQYFFEALTHRSFLQMPGYEKAVPNERLEFLGDSVLSLVVAERLFRQHGDAGEGDLTKIRSRLVNRKALSVYAQELTLGDFILLSPGAAQLDGRGFESILSDGFEAIIGAIYLDGGYEKAHQFIERHIMSAIARGELTTLDQNFKSKLLEYSQSLGYGPPRYLTIKEEGPEHNRLFTIEVYVNGEAHGIGEGKNKKDAEQASAEKALHKLNLL